MRFPHGASLILTAFFGLGCESHADESAVADTASVTTDLLEAHDSEVLPAGEDSSSPGGHATRDATQELPGGDSDVDEAEIVQAEIVEADVTDDPDATLDPADTPLDSSDPLDTAPAVDAAQADDVLPSSDEIALPDAQDDVAMGDTQQGDDAESEDVSGLDTLVIADVSELDSTAVDVPAPEDTSAVDVFSGPDSSPDDIAPDTFVLVPTLVTASPGEPLVASATLLATSVVAAASVGDAVVAVGEAGVSWAGTGPLKVLGPAPITAVDISALDNVQALIGLSATAHVATAAALSTSPLLSAVGGEVSGLAARAGSAPTIWIAGNGKLWRWRAGFIQGLTAAGFDPEGSRLALDLGGAVWVAGPSGVYRVVETAAGADIVVQRPDLTAEDVAVDGLGRVSVVAGGDVHRLEAGSWTWLRFPTPVHHVCARPDVSGSFVVLDTGEAWFVAEDEAWPIADDISGCAVDALGRGLLFGPFGLRRVAVNAPIDVGPEPVTWTGDIYPLFTAKCAKCHGSGGFAHPIFQKSQFESEIDSVLLMVTSGAMPLPPNPVLGSDDIGLIQAWKDGGFVQSP